MGRFGIAILTAILVGGCTSTGGSTSTSAPPPSQGVTMPRTPDPGGRSGSLPPDLAASARHADPYLEAQIPDSVGDYRLAKSSWTGLDMQMTDADAVLAPFAKHPADLSFASAVPGMPPLFEVSAQRLRGVPAERLLAAYLAQTPNAKVTPTTLAGKSVTHVVYDTGLENWDYTTGEVLFLITAQPEHVALAVAALP